MVSELNRSVNYATYRCSVCGATDDYAHTSRDKCEWYSCTVCGWEFGFVNHKTELTTSWSEELGDIHVWRCVNYWYGSGQCNYTTGEEACTPDMSGEVWYSYFVVGGYHTIYRNCKECGYGVERGQILCYKALGNTTCPYCD